MVIWEIKLIFKKALIIFVMFGLNSLYADSKSNGNYLINEMNKNTKKKLKIVNYDNFNMKMIWHYKNIDKSNVYLSMIKKKFQK